MQKNEAEDIKKTKRNCSEIKNTKPEVKIFLMELTDDWH